MYWGFGGEKEGKEMGERRRSYSPYLVVALIVFYELNHPAKAVENYLRFGLTFFLVVESAELVPGSAFLGLEYFQGKELDLGELVRTRN